MNIGRGMASVVGAFILLAGASPAPGAVSERAIGDVQVFARVPDPGQPAGIVVAPHAVYVTTLGVTHHPVTDPKVFVFSREGSLRASHTVPRDMPASAMALHGAALDRTGNLYIVDMNGRIIRLDRRTGEQEIYATFPASVGGLTAMPLDLVFDAAGNAYVTDQNLAAIWRVGPGGSPVELWFQDPRLAGYILGPSGLTMDARNRALYFTVATSAYPATAGQGLLFRLPLHDPSSSTLEEVARYPARSNPFDVALGASGLLYVVLMTPGQISVLEPDGTEVLRFPSAEDNVKQEVPFEQPVGLTFDGRGSLLVTNSSFLRNNRQNMVVFDIFVDDVSSRVPRPWIGSPPTRGRQP